MFLPVLSALLMASMIGAIFMKFGRAPAMRSIFIGEHWLDIIEENTLLEADFGVQGRKLIRVLLEKS